MKKKKVCWPFVFIAPFFIVYGIFNLFPILFSFYISLTNWQGYGPMNYVGFSNYASLLKNGAFCKSVLNSFIIVLEAMIPIQTLGLVLALLLNYGIIKTGRNYIRNAMFLPYVTAPIAIGLIFATLFDQNFGAVNLFLRSIGLIGENINWLHSLPSGVMRDIRQSSILPDCKAFPGISMRRQKLTGLPRPGRLST